MADFEKAIPAILRWEGGYVDHPADPGGATNRGIILTVFKKYAAELGLTPDVAGLKQITEEQAKVIYKKQFWDLMRGDEIRDQQVANIIFDGFVNMGRNGLKIAQRVAGTTIDGQFGPHTISTLNAASGRVFFDTYKDNRIAYYKKLAAKKPKMEVFLKGWLNRINSFTYKSPSVGSAGA